MFREKGIGKDAVRVGALLSLAEKGHLKIHWRIEKFLGDFKSREEAMKAGAKPHEVLDYFKNCLLNEGINLLWTLACGGSGTAFNNANSYIGVGDSATAAAASQTGLQAATNKLYKAMDATYPTFGTSQQVVFRSTFASGDANWHWQEITAANGSSDAAANLNRLVSDMGTKTSVASWVATLTVTLS